MQPTTKAATPSAQAALPMVLRITGIWLIFVCWCQSSGWILSWLGELNAVGYLLTAPIALVVGFVFWRNTRSHDAGRFSLTKWFRRAKGSPSFLAWCVVTLLILVGAIINPPSNYDGINYRLPRLLYWLQENRWHWIDGLDHRQNISGVGHEWMSAPFILFTGSDRGLFLINFLPFLLLPGLFFVAARGLGIRISVARWWMWVWPMAYGIALQAGSIGNDFAAVALAIASLAFAAQALRGKPFLCLFLSALAAAAMTSLKATTLPLGLPLGCYWLWVAWRTLPWQKILLVGISVLPIASVTSFIPIAIACTIHTGVWSGNPGNRHGAEPHHPVAGIVGNTVYLVTGLIELPILPGSSRVNVTLTQLVEDQAWYKWSTKNYPCFRIDAGAELPREEYSGVGIGLTLAGLIWILKGRRKKCSNSDRRPFDLVFAMATVIAMLAYMSKAGMGGTARLMIPFIPISILALLCHFRSSSLIGFRYSSFLQIIPALCLLPTLLLNPNRPIIPPQALTSIPAIPASIRDRMISVHETYQRRSEILLPLQKHIPAGETIGFAGGGNDSALGLFKPYGSRKVINLSPRTEHQLNWIVATEDGFKRRMGLTLSEWESKQEFERIFETKIVSIVQVGPETWYIYKRRHSNP